MACFFVLTDDDGYSTVGTFIDYLLTPFRVSFYSITTKIICPFLGEDSEVTLCVRKLKINKVSSVL